ncbi:MAG: hypothetical protein K0Q49_954 [Haloplasmataceae bacterium]|jgi:hypothetical protein|nr:hypothetical protein [Haloplasmataceae bacterium]
MKVILRIFFLVILLIVAIPCAVIGAILINDASVPTYMQTFKVEEFNAQEEMDKKLQYVMMSNVVGNRSIAVSDEFVAKYLYASSNGFNSFKTQLVEGYNMGVEYVWFTFEDDILTMYGTATLNQTRTTFTAKLAFKDYEGYTEVQINTLKIGKLPIPNSLVVYGLNKYEKQGQDFDNINPWGEFDLEDLSITLEDEYINNMFTDLLKSNLISFSSIKFDNKDITLNYEFSSTPEAVAIDKALTEFNNLVNSEETRTNINISLELLKTDGKIDETTKASIDTVLEMLEAKSNPDVEFAFTEEDMQKINELTTNFSNLNSTQASEISKVFVDNMDPETLEEIKAELSKTDGSKDITQIINEFLGKK